jgi:transcriptional regulator with XRE-family HTH domain
MTPGDLKAFRTARKWSQSRMANELGVGRRTICRWEAGEARIPAAIGKLLTSGLYIEK